VESIAPPTRIAVLTVRARLSTTQFDDLDDERHGADNEVAAQRKHAEAGARGSRHRPKE
jgi:hypothetical protein